MSTRHGFTLPLIIIAILFSIVILAAWSPWVTDGFALNKLKTYSPCPQLAAVPDFKTPSTSQKVLFGRKLIKTESACGTYDIFISALGTVHQVKFYKIDIGGTSDPVSCKLPEGCNDESYPSTQKSKTDETANPDLIWANWKTYTNEKFRYSIQYPSNLQLIVNNDHLSVTNNNNDTKHYFNISIEVSDNTKNQTTQDFVHNSKILTASGEYKNPFVAPKPYTYGEIEGIISDVTNGDDFYVEVIQVNNGKIYEFKLLAGPDTGTKPTDEYRNIFDQILSTFKFLD